MSETIVIDSSALIEYLEKTKSGVQAAKYIDNENNRLIVPNIVCAEVVSKIIRKGKDPNIAIQAIKTFSVPAEEGQEDYFKAGTEHPKLKAISENISLADVVIKVIAEKNKAKILTKDSHLKGKNTILLS